MRGVTLPRHVCSTAPKTFMTLVPRSQREPRAQASAVTMSPPTFLKLLRLVETPAGCKLCTSSMSYSFGFLKLYHCIILAKTALKVFVPAYTAIFGKLMQAAIDEVYVRAFLC